MKQRLLFLLLALATLMPGSLSAFNYQYEGVTLRYDVIDEEAKTCKVIGYKIFSGDLIIPEFANDGTNDYAVTEIDKEVFKENKDLTSVVIGNSVTTIGDSAFSGCSGLTSVVIGNSVTTIGDSAFSGCSGLTSVVIGNSVTTIGDGAFYGCRGLTSVVIGNSVTTIGKSAFYGCRGLTSVVIGNSVTTIGSRAFEDCSGLTSVEIPNSVTTIGDGAFYRCSGLTSVVIGNSVKSIGKSAFYDCRGMTSVVIGNSVTSIGDKAFYDCSGLTSVVIPNLVKYIGEDVFKNCKSIRKYAYPKSLGKHPFETYEGVAYDPEGAVIEDGWVWGPEKSAIYFAPYDIEGKYTIPETVTSIGSGAFSGCSGLTSVEMPNSVTSIGNSAFRNCSGLISVVIPNSVETIGSDAFYLCSKLSSVVIPNSVTSIDSYVFSDCSGLKSVVIPNSVTSIGSGAFWGCSGLTSVVIPNSVTSIGSNAFKGCSGLTSVVIGNSVTSIGSSAFSYCSGLTSVVIPNRVTSIGESAFSNCIGLKSVTIANGKTTLEFGETVFESTPIESLYLGRNFSYVNKYNHPFKGKESLKSVIIGNYVTEIAMLAFEDCSGLLSVEIGNSVTSIGPRAFYRCSGLTSVVIGNSVESIGATAFSGCNLDTIVMGYGVNEIGDYAFYECPASNIYITAQTPPVSDSNIFSKYTGKLWLQGKAAVDAYDNDKYWGNFNSEVMTEPTALTINGLTEISGNAGDTFQLEATMTPSDVTLPYIMWRSTNPKVAAVDTNGKVTFMAFKNDVQTRAEEGEEEGVCKIIAESLYFDGPIAEVTVYNTGIEVASISLNESELNLKAGESSTLTATVSNVEDKTVTWSSSDEAVATVDAEGNVTAVAVGEAVITATCGELSATCKVTVVPTLVETLTIDPTAWNGEEGSEFKITASVLPENATDKTLTWTSSDETVATVDGEGNVKVLKEGNCTITVATTDGSNLTAECVITSVAGVEGIFGEDAVVDVYDMNGVIVKKGCNRSDLQQLLTPGVYVLRSGNATVKAVIR